MKLKEIEQLPNQEDRIEGYLKFLSKGINQIPDKETTQEAFIEAEATRFAPILINAIKRNIENEKTH